MFYAKIKKLQKYSLYLTGSGEKRDIMPRSQKYDFKWDSGSMIIPKTLDIITGVFIVINK